MAPSREYEAGMAPFELLPNEMAEIPIKMAMAKMNRPLQKYEFLANVIARISTRVANQQGTRSSKKSTKSKLATDEIGMG